MADRVQKVGQWTQPGIRNHVLDQARDIASKTKIKHDGIFYSGAVSLLVSN